MISKVKLEHLRIYARQRKQIGAPCTIPPDDLLEILTRLQDYENIVWPEFRSCRVDEMSDPSWRYAEEYNQGIHDCKRAVDNRSVKHED